MKNKNSSVINEMHRQLKNLEKDLQVKRYDFSASDINKQIDKMLDAEFTFRTRLFRKFGKGKLYQKMNDWDYLILKRRKLAVRRLMEEADRRYSTQYPEMCVPDEYMYLNLPCVALTFNGLNNRFYIEMAAAIWILDYLKNNGKYEEAKQLFTKTRAELDKVYLPNLSDALHSDDAIKSVIYLIQNRNRGMNGFDEGKAFIDEADTRIKQTPDCADLPDRKNYEALISLIDADTIKDIEIQFEQYVWDFTDNIFDIVHGYRQREQKARKTIYKAIKSQLNRIENTPIQPVSPLVNFYANEEIDLLFEIRETTSQLKEADEELGECEALAESL